MYGSNHSSDSTASQTLEEVPDFIKGNKALESKYVQDVLKNKYTILTMIIPIELMRRWNDNLGYDPESKTLDRLKMLNASFDMVKRVCSYDLDKNPQALVTIMDFHMEPHLTPISEKKTAFAQSDIGREYAHEYSHVINNECECLLDLVGMWNPEKESARKREDYLWKAFEKWEQATTVSLPFSEDRFFEAIRKVEGVSPGDLTLETLEKLRAKHVEAWNTATTYKPYTDKIFEKQIWQEKGLPYDIFHIVERTDIRAEYEKQYHADRVEYEDGGYLEELKPGVITA